MIRAALCAAACLAAAGCGAEVAPPLARAEKTAVQASDEAANPAGQAPAALVEAAFEGPAAAPAGGDAPSRLSIAQPNPIQVTDPPVLVWDGKVRCEGALTQGGLLVCRGAPGASFAINGGPAVRADAQGLVVLGLSREQGRQVIVTADAQDGRRPTRLTLPIARRAWATQRVNGLPPSTVRPPDDPAIQANIARGVALKAEAARSRAEARYFLEGFVWPVAGARQSGAWGNQRILNGDPRPPHFGMDIAAPSGTPIRAPASAKVVLADAAMHFEGGLVYLDHGQGVITQYLHLSRVDVKPGDVVQQGQVIGAVGATGRATGPHLCWRMRVRDTQIDPAQALLALGKARQAFAGAAAPSAGAAPLGWGGGR